MTPTRVAFRVWKKLPKKGQVIAVLLDAQVVGHPKMRVAYTEGCQIFDIDISDIRFETGKAHVKFYAKLLDDLHNVVGYESILVVNSFSKLRLKGR